MGTRAFLRLLRPKSWVLSLPLIERPSHCGNSFEGRECAP